MLIPAAAAALSVWPDAYSGELLVLEVQPPGSTVNAGDVVARLDTRSLEEAIADAELALASARVQHAGLLERNAVAAEGAASALARANAELDRAKRALAGYETRELEFARRSDALARQREEAWIADQADELGQLEAMYNADELTDATEEIVLKRSRRDLALSRAGNALSEDRRGYNVEHTEALALESRREDVAELAERAAHLVRTQAVEAAERADAVRRSEAELAKKERELARLTHDLELLTLRAPCAGVLLHGSLASYRSGATMGRVERGDRLSPRSDVFLVAPSGQLSVALEIPQTLRASLADGSTVVVRPPGSEVALSGKLAVASHPSGSEGEESTFEATVALDEVPSELVAGMRVRVEPSGAAQ